MKVQGAIRYWKKFLSEIDKLENIRPDVDWKKQREATAMAIEALEKQIPKKPTDQSKVRDNEGCVGLIGKCPCCGEILEEDTVYCDCGQKLDWSE